MAFSSFQIEDFETSITRFSFLNFNFFAIFLKNVTEYINPYGHFVVYLFFCSSNFYNSFSSFLFLLSKGLKVKYICHL